MYCVALVYDGEPQRGCQSDDTVVQSPGTRCSVLLVLNRMLVDFGEVLYDVISLPIKWGC